MIELLAPAGNIEKFFTALHFGADAVYLSGKKFGLRAFADNFETDEIEFCCQYAHKLNKKVYVTVNIFPRNDDFDELEKYIRFLKKANVDAVIVSDAGLIKLIKDTEPNLQIHLSTQANTTNYKAVEFWREMGVERVVLARELSLKEIGDIVLKTDCSGVEIETFVHGAMCISYSGRCLLSNYLSDRDSNKGECAQPCRWEYKLKEVGRADSISVEEDKNGTYFLNSKDLNMIEHIADVINVGVKSAKIEGRMKTTYYVATVVNAYRRAIDNYYKKPIGYTVDKCLSDELLKASHREYTTGFYLNDTQTSECRQNYDSSKAVAAGEFVAVVKANNDGYLTVEMRNRFKVGDVLDILSPDNNFGKQFTISEIFDLEGNIITDAKNVQQLLRIPCPYILNEYDLLCRKI